MILGGLSRDYGLRSMDLDEPAPTVHTQSASRWTLVEGEPLIVNMDSNQISGRNFKHSPDNPAPTLTAGGGPAWLLSENADREPPARVDVPPYLVPSLASINALEPNGYRVVSTFSGCGGSCLGFKMHGFEIVLACEFSDAARQSYALNFPNTPLDGRDIREVTGQDVLTATELEAGMLDVLEGSPPCRSFSTAGKGAKGWGKLKDYGDAADQRDDDLFEEFIRLAGELRPKVIVAENVAGMVKGASIGYFKLVMRWLADLGYRVEARLLDAQWLGVPQVRRRVIFMAVRDDLGVSPRFPSPLLHRYSIRDALREPFVEPLTDETDTDISRFAIGRVAPKLLEGQTNKGAKLYTLTRTNSAAPVPTVTSAAGSMSAASIIHPNGERKFHVWELQRLCGFPDDFRLAGSYSVQVARLGNAVPPPMMAAVAGCVRDILDEAR